MSKTNKTTEASKTELTDEQLDGAQGGGVFAKYDGVDGESQYVGGDRVSESLTLNFAKYEVSSDEITKSDSLSTSTKLKL